MGFIADPGARRVVAALASASPRPHIGVVWTSCDAAATLRFSAGIEQADGALDFAAPVTLSRGKILADPRLLHAPRGLSEQDPRGGWFVLWTEASEPHTALKLARIPEGTPQRILDVRTLATGALGSPILHPSPEEPGVGYALTYARGTEPGVRSYSLVCR